MLRTDEKPFVSKEMGGKKEASRGDVGASSPALRHNQPVEEVGHMPFEHDYGDSIPTFNRIIDEQAAELGGFEPIGTIAARLVEAAQR